MLEKGILEIALLVAVAIGGRWWLLERTAHWSSKQHGMTTIDEFNALTTTAPWYAKLHWWLAQRGW